MNSSAEWESFVPATVQAKITEPTAFYQNLQRHHALSDQALVRCVDTCLSNLERLDYEHDTTDADTALRLILVPELCERLVPGVRSRLRRRTSSLAEHHPDPKRPSIFERILHGRAPWGTAARSKREQARDQSARGAASLRASITFHAEMPVFELVRRTHAAIAGSHVIQTWNPADIVYEPGFTYRVVPVLMRRVLHVGGSKSTPYHEPQIP